MVARVVGYSKAEFLSRADFSHGLVLDLHGLDPLAEVAGVARDMDCVADPHAA